MRLLEAGFRFVAVEMEDMVGLERGGVYCLKVGVCMLRRVLCCDGMSMMCVCVLDNYSLMGGSESIDGGRVEWILRERESQGS